MSKGIIYQVDGAGTLTKMMPGKPASEDEIQKLIAEHPEMVTGIDEQLLLIRREAPIPDRIDGQERWSLDHLFVARDGKPVLVEVKQASNTQLRREVIGQILEYGANAAFYWGQGRLAQAFFARFEQEEDAQQALDAFLRSDGDGADALEVGNPTSFWERVEANLQAGVLKLVIVADQIPRELARIVEFLNEQMTADVQAVELRWYTAPGGLTALVPNIIGATERAAERKSDPVAQTPNEYWIDLKGKYPKLLTGKPWKDAAQDLFSLRTGNPKIVVGCNSSKMNSAFTSILTTSARKKLTRYSKKNRVRSINYMESHSSGTICPVTTRPELWTFSQTLIGSIEQIGSASTIGSTRKLWVLRTRSGPFLPTWNCD